jgi:hypothetical protein
MLTKCIRMLDEFDRGFNVRFTYSPTSRFGSNKSMYEQFRLVTSLSDLDQRGWSI